MVAHIDYWLEVYTDRLKVDVKYALEDGDYIKEVGVDQYLEELKQGISNQSAMGCNSAHKFPDFKSALAQTGSAVNSDSIKDVDNIW